MKREDGGCKSFIGAIEGSRHYPEKNGVCLLDFGACPVKGSNEGGETLKFGWYSGFSPRGRRYNSALGAFYIEKKKKGR